MLEGIGPWVVAGAFYWLACFVGVLAWRRAEDGALLVGDLVLAAVLGHALAPLIVLSLVFRDRLSRLMEREIG